MKPFSWEAIAKIFDTAMDLPTSARRKFITEACDGDSELEFEVVKLMAADEEVGSFLETPVLGVLASRSPLPPTPPMLASGTLISGRFVILRMIGQGGMGQVYEVLDQELNSRVALKTIRPEISSDSHVLARFRREVAFTRQITHPNVCRTFDIDRHSCVAADGTETQITFLTMELLDGETLSDVLSRRSKLPLEEALPLIQQMAAALNAAHVAGIVHRDFKPSNVLLVPSKAGLRIVVTDFGLARALVLSGHMSLAQTLNSSTGSLSLLGTLIYMAPEQLEHAEATVASDIYAFGLVIYEMITGHRPFANSMPFVEAVMRISSPAPSAKLYLPDLSFGWDATIQRCLETDPTKRLENVLQVVEGILQFHTDSLPRPVRNASEGLKSPKTLVGAKQVRKALRRTAAIAFFVVLVSLLTMFIRYYRVKKENKLPVGTTILMTAIQNRTRDNRFDGTTDLIRHQLLQSPYFSLLNEGRIRNELVQMEMPPNAELDPPTARNVALRVGVPRIIFGAVSRVGDSCVLDIEIEQPDNNPSRSRAQWENHWTWRMPLDAPGRDMPGDFLQAIREGSDWIRKQVGESANDIAREDTPPQDVTTASWAALSEFSQAEKFKAAGRANDAVIALQNAIAADPGFALGYARLGDLFVSLGRFDEGYRAYRSALSEDQRQRLTRREKDRIKGIYASDAEDFTAAETVFHDYTAYYPNDYLGWFYRAYPLMMLGRVEEGIASLENAEAIDPEIMSAPAHIARFYLIQGNFTEASKWIQHVRSKGHFDDGNLLEAEIDFLQHDYQTALNVLKDLEQSKDATYRSYAFSLRARVYAEIGQYQNALNALEQGSSADLIAGDLAHRADKLLDRAYINLKREQYEACLKDIKLSLDSDRSFQRSLLAGTILSRAASEAPRGSRRRLITELRKISERIPSQNLKPLSDIVHARLQGEVLFAEGDWMHALENFKRADRLEAPVKDREYLARSLLTAAQHTIDKVAAAPLRQEALTAYSVTAFKPGQIWQWAIDFPPGYLSDETFSFVKTSLESGKVDSRVKVALDEYLKKRLYSDPGLIDVEQARRFASWPVFAKH
ncbi:protein kinase domain-containing protein [Tunturiibacter gelidoferens]|uniref:Serine/threonine protein kinase/tetratricopeptide (TPR) repeat protein n=1 Tax=Tunturiibacter gelidiferens TaxID=3069689 RepID=A0ACC5NTD9_9BACT|nr:serine/threonine-protein kinase [Edaphobacter lichenicola]MBB5337838.1 serine/threonine protein kinase/tetratricopeptide (TPR) repeat protein [Edaphobacter lichenicola]